MPSAQIFVEGGMLDISLRNTIQMDAQILQSNLGNQPVFVHHIEHPFII